MSVIYCILVVLLLFFLSSFLPKVMPMMGRQKHKREKTLMICNEWELLLIICVNCMSEKTDENDSIKINWLH